MTLLSIVKSALLVVLLGDFAFGLFVLAPMKIRLLKRVGLDKTNDDLISLGKNGDPEAILLHTRSRWFIAVGIAAGLPLVLLR